MNKKRTYRAVDVQTLTLDPLLATFVAGSVITVAIDVAKRKFLCALASEEGEVEVLLRFEHPSTTNVFLVLLEQLMSEGRKVVAVMEPTGTYGDALRHQLYRREIEVYRVSTKHVHDIAELYDKVPSKHDAKDACLIAWLHAHGRSARWVELPENRRRMRALLSQRDLFDDPLRRLITQLEPLLARHFPELEQFFELSRRKTPYVLLQHFPSPAELARCDLDALVALLAETQRKAPDTAEVARLREAARRTHGAPMINEERDLVREMVTEIIHLFDRRRAIDKRIESAAETEPEIQALRPALGAATAAVIIAHMGSPTTYKSAAAFEKAAGLNLREHSSGTREGNKHISKRGPGRVRKYLFLAAMRLVQHDPIVRAWYQARTAYKGNDKGKALVAVLRKLTRALYHVARGESFDAYKLFDVRKLAIEAEAA
jgi:transposase